MTDRAELTRQLDATTRLLAEFQIKYAAEKNRALDLEAKLAAAEADAQRYRWLRDTLHGAKCGGGVEVNDALQVYEQPVSGEEVRVYWYQDTPVGFYQSHGTTLDEAIDSAREGK